MTVPYEDIDITGYDSPSLVPLITDVPKKRSWKDNLQKASFKKLEFFVSSHSLSVGRRLVSHEFPYQNEPYLEDMGRKSRQYNIEGFILAEDYFKLRNDFIKAAEAEESGTLIHPYLGSLKVKCETLSTKESKDNGRYASLSFVFKEDIDNKFIITQVDKGNIVDNNSDKLKDESLINYKEIYKDLDIVKSKIDKAKKFVADKMDDLNKVQKLCADVADIGNQVTQYIKEVSNALDKYIQFPDLVGSFFESAFAGLSYAIDKSLSKSNPKRVSLAFSLFQPYSSSLISSDSTIVSTSNYSVSKNSPDKDRKRINAWASLAKNKQKTNSDFERIVSLTTRSLATCYLVDAATTSTYSSADDAQAVLNLILTISDELMEDPFVSDEMFSSILDLQNSTHEYMVAIENELPIIHSFTIEKDTNLLSFLYDNFGNLDKENEVIMRNNIRDLFEIKAGTTLMVAL